jgi:NodT family efflux transporter outer membrane factor (OMF) lipoprotein
LGKRHWRLGEKARGHRPRLQLSLIFLLFFGCTVGPRYTPPPTPTPPAYKEPPPDNFKEADDWKSSDPQDALPRGKWWEIFCDADLNALQDQVNISNQDIASAEGRFRAARAAIRVARAGLFPTLTVGPNATLSRVPSTRVTSSSASISGAGAFYQLPIDFSYEADVWGQVRRTVESNIENTQANAADVETIRLSVHSELAMDYFQLRGLDAEQKLFEDTIAGFARALQLTQNRYRQGIASQLDVAQAQTQLDTTRAQATDLGVQRAQFEHAIAVLRGDAPAELTIAVRNLEIQPPVIPVGLPSQLLERRPDIAAAERRAAAANALIGVAKAAYFPTISFNLIAGVEGSKLANLFSWPSRFWLLGPSLAQTVFDGGRRRGLTEVAEATYDSAVGTYRQTVLTAFQDVEDNLAALRILAEEAAQQDVAIASSQLALDLALHRYRGGITTYLDVVTAQNVLLSNQRTAIDIRSRRMLASVLLIKALGGGWNTTDLPSANTLVKNE